MDTDTAATVPDEPASHVIVTAVAYVAKTNEDQEVYIHKSHRLLRLVG